MRKYSAVLLCVLVFPLCAQTKTDSPVLEALLADVRQLRLALERSNTIAPRVQIVLQRMILQQSRVDRLATRVQDFRSRISASAAEDSRMAGENKVAEGRLDQEQDPVRHREMEIRIQAIKEELERSAARDQQLRAEEIEISGQLSTEQAKLEDLDRQLQALEAQLSPPKTN